MKLLDYSNFPIYAIMAYFFGAFVIVAFGHKKSFRAPVAVLSTALGLAFLCLLVKPVLINGQIISYWMGNRSIAGGYAIGIALEVDALNLFFGLMLGVAGFISCIYSIRYMEHDVHIPQYYTLFLMLCGGVLGMVLTGDLFNMFIMVEILTFAAVALTAFRKNNFGALEAAFKYFVVGSIGSSCILVGVIMLYAQAHTLNIAQLSALIPGNLNNATKLALALLFVGFSTKAFIVPFHPLAADAHGAAPASVSVMISGVLTKSGIYALIRLGFFLFGVISKESIQVLIVIIGSLSMFVCVTMALAQHDFKRLLAFHSISQIGYVLTGIGLFTGLGMSAGLFHAMNHTIFKSLLFLCAGSVIHATGTADLGKLGGLSKRMPVTTSLFLIGAASISGIPPFNGFASKWMLYQAIYDKAVQSGNIIYLIAVIVALITSVLTLASFIKVTQSVFFGRLSLEHENVKESPVGMQIAMGMFAVLCIIPGLFPTQTTKLLTIPAAKAAFSAERFINSMMGSGYAESVMGENLPVSPVLSFSQLGTWDPVSWLLLMCIALLAVTSVCVLCRYDSVSSVDTIEAEGKYDIFFGGEKSVYSQVGGGDLFWGFKHNWRGYFKVMQELHSGVVNDYALWAVVALALAIVIVQIIL